MAGIRKIEVRDAQRLYEHLSNPRVARFSRLKPSSIEEMISMVEYLIEEENEHRIIPRVIVDIHDEVVGMIILWDYCPFRREGFLATWLGEEHWGKGYNQVAKSLFFDELFTLHYLNNIYLLIRAYNERSLAASRKFPYISIPTIDEELELRSFYKEKIANDHVILLITKEDYQSYSISEEQTS